MANQLMFTHSIHKSHACPSNHLANEAPQRAQLQALLFGGVAFVSMVAANVPFITFLLELCRGKRPWERKLATEGGPRWLSCHDRRN